MLISYVLQFLLVIVGASALVVFIIQKRDELKTSATIVSTQIQNIDSNVKQRKGQDTSLYITTYSCARLLNENSWAKHKPILTKKLSHADIVILDDYFNNVEFIDKNSEAIVDLLSCNWECKSMALQFSLAEIISNMQADLLVPEIAIQTEMTQKQSKYLKEIEDFFNLYSPLSHNFQPTIPLNAYIHSLNNYSGIIGTVAFQKLEKMAFKNK